jgi:hypothetical protein
MSGNPRGVDAGRFEAHRLLEPQATSLAWRVRAGEVDVTTALSAEALAWLHRSTSNDLHQPNV